MKKLILISFRYKEELSLLKDHALAQAKRDDLRIAKITDPKIVKKYKKQYNREWFGEFSSNSIVLFKKKTATDDNVRFYDLASDTSDIGIWLIQQSLDPVDELVGTSFKIMAMLNKPMLVAYINREDPRYVEESLSLLKTLNEFALKYK